MKLSLLFVLFITLLACGNSNSGQDSIQKPKAFTPVNACVLSEITYCLNAQEQLDKHLPGWKLVWEPVAISGIYAFVATDGDNYALAIRGSLMEFSWDAFDNWIYKDLNIVSQQKWTYTKTEKAKISEGSFQGWRHLEQLADKKTGKKLWDFIKENTNKQKPLILTGHSLGGNLATVYASYLTWKFKEAKIDDHNINVITFASPAAGNEAFAKDFNEQFPNSIRIENSNDIVPKFPCSDKLSSLGKLYAPFPAASDVSVGYKSATVPLSKVFDLMSFSQKILEFSNDSYCQTNGEGQLITVQLSGKNKKSDALEWFAEAGYQHGIAQYATAMGAPVVICGQ